MHVLHEISSGVLFTVITTAFVACGCHRLAVGCVVAVPAGRPVCAVCIKVCAFPLAGTAGVGAVLLHPWCELVRWVAISFIVRPGFAVLRFSVEARLNATAWFTEPAGQRAVAFHVGWELAALAINCPGPAVDVGVHAALLTQPAGFLAIATHPRRING